MAAVAFLSLIGRRRSTCLALLAGTAVQNSSLAKSMHQQMAQLLQQVKANPHQTGLALMMFSLIYGVLHAVGPGHGKVVIVTYLATHPAQLKTV